MYFIITAVIAFLVGIVAGAVGILMIGVGIAETEPDYDE